MDEIKEQLQAIRDTKYTKDAMKDILRLIELVEEKQVDNSAKAYFFEPIQEDYDEPPRVSRQLSE